jgi:hypothetical protein
MWQPNNQYGVSRNRLYEVQEEALGGKAVRVILWYCRVPRADAYGSLQAGAAGFTVRMACCKVLELSASNSRRVRAVGEPPTEGHKG